MKVARHGRFALFGVIVLAIGLMAGQAHGAEFTSKFFAVGGFSLISPHVSFPNTGTPETLKSGKGYAFGVGFAVGTKGYARQALIGAYKDRGTPHRFSLNLEILYSERAFQMNATEIRSKYVALPLYLQYAFSILNVQAGGYLARRTGMIEVHWNDSENSALYPTIGDNNSSFTPIKPIDYGLLVGASLRGVLPKIFLGARYYYGLANAYDTSGDASLKHRALEAFVGVDL